MPQYRIEDYFEMSPFASKAGKMARRLGASDFLVLNRDSEFLKLVEMTFKKPVSVRLVVGPIGSGKSWMLSWIWRESEKWKTEQGRTLVLGIPRMELRRVPERALVEGLFSSFYSNLPSHRDRLDDIGTKDVASMDVLGKYILAAMNDDGAYLRLSGMASGQLPKLGDLSPPSKATSEGLMNLAVAFFKVLRRLGYAQILVLIDEAEALFIMLGKKDLKMFAHFLRGLYDEFEGASPDQFPTVQFIMAGTSSVLEEISPAYVGKPTAASDMATALMRRLEPVVSLEPPSPDEVLKVAEHRIGIHRKQDLKGPFKPYIPYDKDAILHVWNNCFGIMGEFCKYLQRMYELARDDGASRITTDYAKRALAEFGYSQEE